MVWTHPTSPSRADSILRCYNLDRVGSEGVVRLDQRPGSLACNLVGATELSSEQRAPGGEAEAEESDEYSGGISRLTRLDIAPAPVVSFSAVIDAYAKNKERERAEAMLRRIGEAVGATELLGAKRRPRGARNVAAGYRG